MVASGVFALAALAHVLRYVLLLINRTVLLPPLVAAGSLLMGIMVSLAAIVAVAATAFVTTSWLIARRAEVFGRHGQPDPRPEWALWVGCLVPPVNLVWAPVLVLELAHAERSYQRMRGPVVAWWIGWVLTTLICAWAIWTSRATEPQSVADNTVTVIVAYLAGLAVLILLGRVFDGFVGRPLAQRELHRWVVVADSGRATEPDGKDAVVESEDAVVESEDSVVESKDSEPAA